MRAKMPGLKWDVLTIIAVVSVLTLADVTRGATIYSDSFEPDNGWTNARTLVPSAWQARSIHTTTDVDYVTFSAISSHVYSLEAYDLSPTNFNTVIYLYDSAGTNLLATNDDIVAGVNLASRINWTNTTAAATTWYVRVESLAGLSTGYYNLAVTDITGIEPDGWEPDDSSAQAKAVVSGAVQTNLTLNSTGDLDYVQFDLIANNVYRLAAVNLDPTLDVAIRLYGQMGTNLLSTLNNNDSGIKETLIWTATNTGVGYAAVYGAFGQLGAYTLTFDDFGAAVSPVTNAVFPEPIFGSPAISADSAIYVGAGSGLYAIAASSGVTQHVWRAHTTVSTTVIGTNGIIYALASSNLYEFTPDGLTNRVWQLPSILLPYLQAPAIGADGSIYVATQNKVLSLNPNGTTNRTWAFTANWYNYYTPPVIGAGGTVYATDYFGGLYALDPQGALENVWYLSTFILSPTVLGTDGTVYFGGYDSNLYACAPGGTIAHTWLTGRAWASPVIGADGAIYVSTLDGNVYSLNSNGTTNYVWNVSGPEFSTLWSAPVIGADGTIYVPTRTHLFALNPTGTVNWVCPGVYGLYASPTIAPDGTLYMPSFDGRLTSIPGTGGLGQTPWPKAFGNIYNTGRIQQRAARADFDGDGKADPAVFRSASGTWSVLLSGAGYTLASASGMGNGFQAIAADYDGDGRVDPAAYLNGAWIGWLSGSGYAVASGSGFGGAGQTPVVADYDGDGKADPAVFTTSSGGWQVLLSGSSYALASADGFGAGQTPVVADYDGDGKADPAVFSASSGSWQVLLSGSSYALVAASGLGGAGSTPVPADYDGDGHADPAVYASGIWTMWLSRNGYAQSLRITSDGAATPVPADYDGDSLADPAVYQQSSGTWTVLFSDSNYAVDLFTLGGAGYVPAMP